LKDWTKKYSESIDFPIIVGSSQSSVARGEKRPVERAGLS